MQTSLKKIENQNHFAGIGAINDNGQLYSSLYLVEQINIFRKEEGNRAVLRHDTLILKIEKEFEEEIREQKFLESSYAQKMPNGGEKESKMYELDFEQSLQILMSESKTVRKAVVQVLKKKQQPKELSRKELILIALQAEEEKEKLLLENLELKPKAEYTDQVLKSDRTYLATEVAKDLGFTSAKAFNRFLKANHICYNVAGVWVTYAQYSGKNYTKTRTEPYLNSEGKTCTNSFTVWTEEGRMFLNNFFNNRLSA